MGVLMDCPFCDGTGGSIGNEDPADDWICSVCEGSGVVPDDEFENDEPNDEE